MGVVHIINTFNKKGLIKIKYPVNVSPHMTSVDATKQQSFSFDFYGNDLTGVECYLYDAITNQYIITYYAFGRADSNSIVEESTATTLNMQKFCCNFGQIGTKNYRLENNRKYKYKLRIAQTKINQFVFQGGIVGIVNNQQLIVVGNTLLHPPVEYANSFITFGYYLAIDIGNERRRIINSYVYDDSNYCIVLDSPFTQSLSIGTQYRVYSNYITSPEFVFKTKKDPTLEIISLDNSYLSNGGSAWFCKYEQEDGILIKNYNWSIKELSSNSEDIYSGNIYNPSAQSTSITKNVSTEKVLTTKGNTQYLINDYNNVVESEIAGDNIYLEVVWSDIIDNTSSLKDDVGNKVYISGTKEFSINDKKEIKLNYYQFKLIEDSGYDKKICYVKDFTIGLNENNENQDILVQYFDTFGTLLGTCTLKGDNMESGGCYRMFISKDNRNTSAEKIELSIVKISDIPEETKNKDLSIIVQSEYFNSFIDDRYYILGNNQDLKIIWSMKETIPSSSDENYSDGFIFNSQTLYIDKNLKNIINKTFSIEDYAFDNRPRTIIGYDETTGAITVDLAYDKYPSTSAIYHIRNNTNNNLITTEDIYKINTFYRCNYLAIDKVLQGTINIRTENDSLFTLSKAIAFPRSEKDENGSPLDILYYLDKNNNIILDDNATENDTKINRYFNTDNGLVSIIWKFKSGYVINTQYVSIYREEENRKPIDLIYNKAISETDTNLLSYSDYTIANNIKYRYIILLQVKATQDIIGETIYRYYKYTTDWFSVSNDGWIISGLEKTSRFACGKPIHKIKESWKLYAQLNSGDIVQNINSKIYNGYGSYVKVGKLENNYVSGTITTMLGTINCIDDEFEDNIQKVNSWRTFISEYNVYVLRSDKGDIWYVSISDNPTTSYDEDNNLYTTITFSYVQVGDIHDIYIES